MATLLTQTRRQSFCRLRIAAFLTLLCTSTRSMAEQLQLQFRQRALMRVQLPTQHCCNVTLEDRFPRVAVHAVGPSKSATTETTRIPTTTHCRSVLRRPTHTVYR